MSENEIKPVAWRYKDYNPLLNGGYAFGYTHDPESHVRDEPLYDQSTIDRLTAERDQLQRKYDELTGERFSDRCHAALKSRAERAEAERDAAVADSERYRMLRNADPDADGLHIVDTGLDTWGNHYSEYLVEDEADAEIDAAMKEQEQGK